jgi:hypothetical protein
VRIIRKERLHDFIRIKLKGRHECYTLMRKFLGKQTKRYNIKVDLKRVVLRWTGLSWFSRLSHSESPNSAIRAEISQSV